MTADLFTEQTWNKLLENGQLRKQDEAFDPEPVVKLFGLPGEATWLLTEIDPESPDIAFGLCDLNLGCAELGTVSLSEITDFFDLGVVWEFKAEAPISRYAAVALKAGRIIEYGLDEPEEQSSGTPTT